MQFIWYITLFFVHFSWGFDNFFADLLILFCLIYKEEVHLTPSLYKFLLIISAGSGKAFSSACKRAGKNRYFRLYFPVFSFWSQLCVYTCLSSDWTVFPLPLHTDLHLSGSHLSSSDSSDTRMLQKPAAPAAMESETTSEARGPEAYQRYPWGGSFCPDWHGKVPAPDPLQYFDTSPRVSSFFSFSVQWSSILSWIFSVNWSWAFPRNTMVIFRASGWWNTHNPHCFLRIPPGSSA